MPDRKRKLGQTRGAGSGFHVTEVGFDRTDPKRAIGTPTSAQRGSKRICFDWITDWSAGPMGFDGSYPVRVDYAVVGSLDHRFLLRTTWHRDAGSLAVLVDRSGEETCINAITVDQGAIQRFEKQGDRTFGPDIAVSAGIERLAAAIAGEHAGLRKSDTCFRHKKRVGASDDDALALALSNGAGANIQCDQRGRAGGIDDQTWAAKIECIGHPVRNQTHSCARVGMQIRVITPSALNLAVIRARASDIDPDRV